MIVTIPTWLLWVLGIAAGCGVLLLAALGAIFLWHWRR